MICVGRPIIQPSQESFAVKMKGLYRGVSYYACGKHYLESPQALARRDGAPEFHGLEIGIGKNERHPHIVPDNDKSPRQPPQINSPARAYAFSSTLT
jgi:hypothetical protein